MKALSLKRTAGFVMAAGLIFAACGSDDEGSSSTDAPAETGDDTEADGAAGGDELVLTGTVEVAAGTTLELDTCPEDWDPLQGVDGDEIRIGQTLPESGALAGFGAIGEGMEMYFDYVNDNEPVDGKTLVRVVKDDAYEAGRAVSNVEEMIDTEDIFAFAHIIGTPTNLAIRPLTDEACVPQLFDGSGFPFWGDPVGFPWTVGNVLNYVTEAEIWCEAIVEEFGEGATVAVLAMNNDFGKTYSDALQGCEADGMFEIVGEQFHDQAAPDLTNEMTTLIATDADVLIGGTTASFCPQVAAEVAGSQWRPRTYISYTCNNLASFFAPVQDEVETLNAEGGGIRIANSTKICGDPAYADDPAIIETEEVLAEYGDVTCADGAFSTGVLYGQYLVDVLRDAAALPGGLNRVNLMHAVWNADTSSEMLLGGTLKLDGVNDAYWIEGAQIQEIVVVDGVLGFESKGEFIDKEGQGGSYAG